MVKATASNVRSGSELVCLSERVRLDAENDGRRPYSSDMPPERSTVEILVPNEFIGELGFLRIRPVIVDTSFLVSDVLESARNRRQSSFLEAVAFGGLRPFAAHHVWAEMGRKVVDVPASRELDADFASRVWWEAYIPRIRFVDVTGLPVPSADEILARDRSDAPTFALAGLLAPVVVLAADRDIRDLGVAKQSYRAVVRDAGTLTVIHEGSWGAMVALSAGIGAIRWSYRTIASALRHPPGQLAALVAALALLVTSDRWMPPTKERLPEWWRQSRATWSGEVLPRLEELYRAYEFAAQRFEQAAFTYLGTSLEQRVARVLAASPHALNRTQLAPILLPHTGDGAQRQLIRELGPILRDVNAFSPVSARKWQLGRAGLDFGGSLERVQDLLAPASLTLPPLLGSPTSQT